MQRHFCFPVSFFALLFALFLGTGKAFAYDFSATCATGQTLYYNITDATHRFVELTCPGNHTWDGFTKPTGNITLPGSVTHNGVTYSVKAIGDYAFYWCEALSGPLTIPSAVTTIGENAFLFCVSLTSLTLGNSLTTIGDKAFLNCAGLVGSLVIPNSVVTIGENAFQNCFQFSNLTIGNSVTSIGKSAFRDCSGFSGALTIPNSVTSIGDYAFGSCNGFTGKLTLGNSVTTIGEGAFYNCSGFTGALTIPNSVVSIGYEAFYYCSGFSGALTIGSSVSALGGSAFMGCSGITTLKYNAVNCQDLTYTSRVFEDFTGTITIGNTVQRIPANLLYGCTGFTGTLTIPSSVTSIGQRAFYNCSGFAQVNYEAVNCSDVSSDAKPFEGCVGTLVIGEDVSRIPAYVFWYSGFTGSLILPNSLITIGNGAFGRNSGFTGALTIPDGVTTIGADAFSDCRGLTGPLTIGRSVVSIGSTAFSAVNSSTCYSSITALPETPPSISFNSFMGFPVSIPVFVPCGSLEDYQSASGWSQFTNIQSFPYRITVTAIPPEGGSVTGGGTYPGCTTQTVTAVPNANVAPYYQFLHWSKDGEVVSLEASYSFELTEDVELEAVFMRKQGVGDIIGEGNATSDILPSYPFYKYSLSQQIYTPEELGPAKTISSISFFNAGEERTRNYDIYLAHTAKTVFSNGSDWISMNASNKVFSGMVTLRKGQWTTIVFDTPFAYNGSSNLVIVMDDNTGSYSNPPHMSCRTFPVSTTQSICGYSDSFNNDPLNPSGSGNYLAMKNQLILNRTVFNINAVSANASAGSVSGAGQYGYGDVCHLIATPNPGYIFMDWIDNTGTVVSTNAICSFVVEDNKDVTAVFLPEGDYCSLTFDLHDRQGDGWTNNYLVLNLENGLMQKMTVPTSKSDVSFSLPVENGSHVELGWILGDNTGDCSFKVSYENGNVIFLGSGATFEGGFLYGFDVDCDEMPTPWVYIGNGGTASDVSLPSHSYYRYSISEQIYTADEIGRAGSINSIAFYNQTSMSRIRTYDIYLKPTDKTQFNTSSEAVNVVAEDKVFSGSVEMASNQWTIITFDTPFDYDGSANLVVVVDDNTGDYATAPYMACRVFSTSGTQAIRYYSDDMNFNPAQSSNYSYSFLGVKNQVYFGFTQEPSTVTQTLALSAGWNWVSLNVEITMDDLKSAVVAANPGAAPVMKSKGNGQTSYNGAVWVGALKTLDLSQMYEIKVANACTINLEGVRTNPADHPATIKNGVNWIAYPL
ncbi:MAG: leucine-rich repeat domain-containing protein, partial [Bacteroidales bacterium]|nr:leucine-rich repeat domain-containing protein [Bacteroidales bacterium]